MYISQLALHFDAIMGKLIKLLSQSGAPGKIEHYLEGYTAAEYSSEFQMHSNHVIHRDIKSVNVLVTERITCKIAD